MPLALKLSPWIKYRLASVTTAGMKLWHKMTASAWTGANRMPDDSGSGNTGALFTGRGLDFDGVNDYVDMGNPAISCKTLVLYINPDSTTANDILQLTATIHLDIIAGVLTATGWTSPTLYVNGVAATAISSGVWQQVSVTSATAITVNDMELGRIMGMMFYDGKMSNVKIFSTELTAGQVAELYAAPEQALPTGASSSDLVGWWTLTEASTPGVNFNKGVFAGVINGATEVTGIEQRVNQIGLTGKSGKYFFDGSNDVVNFGNLPTSGLTNFSLSMWFLRRATNQRCFIGKGSGTARWSIGQYQDNRIYFDCLNGSISGGDFANSSVARLHHLVATFDGSGSTNADKMKMYLDGVAQTLSFTATLPTTLPTSSADFTSSGGGELYFGFLDELAVWNVTLSASDVTNLFAKTAATSVQASGLIGYWRNKNSTTWTDLSTGGRNGTVTGSPAEFYLPQGVTAGKDVLGFDLNLSNSGNLLLNGDGYEVATDAASIDITTNITIEAWLKPFQVTALQSAIGKNGAYTLEINASGKPQFSKWTSTTKTSAATTSTVLAVNVWKHIACTFDGTDARIYIDGVLDTTTAMTGAMDANANDVLIGALTSSTQLFSGYLDTVKVYDAVLTGSQILVNYNAEKTNYQ